MMDLLNVDLNAVRNGKVKRSDKIEPLLGLNYRGLLDAATNVPVVGDALSGGLALYDAAKGDYGSAALNALGVLPFVSGTFIGKGAKTWDKVKEADAMSRLAKGEDRAKVWLETGIGHAPWQKPGTDAAFRSEIDDSVSTYNPNAYKQKEFYVFGKPAGKGSVANVSELLDHKKLVNSYPDLSGVSVREMPSSARNDVYGTGEYSPATDSIGIGTAVPNNGEGVAESLLDFASYKDKPVLLHELQHAIQQREGWAKGGNPEMFNPKEAEKARDILSWRREVEQWIGKNWPNAKVDTEVLRNADQRLRDEYGALDAYSMVPPAELRDMALSDTFKNGSEQRSAIEQMVKEYGLDKRVTPPSANQMYNRLAGEAEARLTQHRMNLTPQERLQQYPYDPAYFKQATGVDINDLIVRGLLDQ